MKDAVEEEYEEVVIPNSGTSKNDQSKNQRSCVSIGITVSDNQTKVIKDFEESLGT